MKIKKIEITGFRSIKNTITLELEDINAFIGPNNAGKSNILLAIYKVLGYSWVTVNSFDDNDVNNLDFDTDINISVEFDTPIQYEQFKSTNIEIPKIQFLYTRYKRGENKGQRRLDKSCLKLDNSPVYGYKNSPARGNKPEYIPLTTIPQEVQDSIPVIYITAGRELKNHLPNARNSMLGNLLKDINDDFLREDNILEVIDESGVSSSQSRFDYFNKCIKQAISALSTDEFKKLEISIKNNALLQLGFDPKKNADNLDIYFSPLTSLDFYKSLNIYLNENNFSQNATELGHGFQNAIVIAILKSFEERKKQGAIFLIEEPEMYLHPHMQRSLYKTIREIGQSNQVLYITHSPHFVTIPHFNEIHIVRKDTESTNICKSEIQYSDKLKEKFNKELKVDRNEMFFAKKILLVEGDTERLSIPIYAEVKGCDIETKGISIVDVGGKRNLIDFIELVISLKIPLGFIYDTDSSDFKGKSDEETEYNKKLESYRNQNIFVYSYEKNYEEQLKKYYGEKQYLEMCQKHSGYSKAIRARLFAMDTIMSPKNRARN